MHITPPSDWQVITEDRDRTDAIITACRCGAQSAFESLYASTSPASRPPLSYCLYLATTVSQWTPLVSYILSLDTRPLASWARVQEKTPAGRNLSYTDIHEYVVFSILSSVAKGDTAMVQVFLDAGLDQNHALESRHDRAECLLERAVMTKQMPMARFLVSRGADPNILAMEDMAVPCSMVSYAATFDSPGILRLLVAEGNGELKGSWALWRAAEISSIDVAETLLDLGVDINEVFVQPLYRKIQPADTWGTALHAAVTENKIKFVEWLLRKGINPKLKDGHGQTALDLAIKDGHLEIQEALKTWATEHQNTTS